MRILSFDCGIKNLAYCLVEINSHPHSVQMINDIKECYKSMKNIFMEEPIRMELNRLLDMEYKLATKKYFTILDWKNISLIDSNVKVKSMNGFQLSKILVDVLDTQIKPLLPVDYILIESQPKVNPKMKIVQYLIHNYFLIRGVVDNPDLVRRGVHFVSPKHKLRGTTGPEYEQIKRLFRDIPKGTPYAKRKQVSTNFARYIVGDDEFNKWIVKKKDDDLADCFNQLYGYYPLLVKTNRNR